VRVHSLGIPRIEDEESDNSAQIEHAPGAATIVRNIGAAHIAGDENRVDIVRASGGIEHGRRRTGPDHIEVAGPLRLGDREAEETSATTEAVNFMRSFVGTMV